MATQDLQLTVLERPPGAKIGIGVVDSQFGPSVSELLPGSMGAQCGAQIGDVVLRVNGTAVASQADVYQRLTEATGQILVIVRRGQPPVAVAFATAVPPTAVPVQVAAQPMPVVAPMTVVAVPAIGNSVPLGAPPGGHYGMQTFIGPITLIAILVLVLVFWPCACTPLLCPCDTREVYFAPDGTTRTRTGRQVGVSVCCGHPCMD